MATSRFYVVEVILDCFFEFFEIGLFCGFCVFGLWAPRSFCFSGFVPLGLCAPQAFGPSGFGPIGLRAARALGP